MKSRIKAIILFFLLMAVTAYATRRLITPDLINW